MRRLPSCASLPPICRPHVGAQGLPLHAGQRGPDGAAGLGRGLGGGRGLGTGSGRATSGVKSRIAASSSNSASSIRSCSSSSSSVSGRRESATLARVSRVTAGAAGGSSCAALRGASNSSCSGGDGSSGSVGGCARRGTHQVELPAGKPRESAAKAKFAVVAHRANQVGSLAALRPPATPPSTESEVARLFRECAETQNHVAWWLSFTPLSAPPRREKRELSVWARSERRPTLREAALATRPMQGRRAR